MNAAMHDPPYVDSALHDPVVLADGSWKYVLIGEHRGEHRARFAQVHLCQHADLLLAGERCRGAGLLCVLDGDWWIVSAVSATLRHVGNPILDASALARIFRRPQLY